MGQIDYDKKLVALLDQAATVFAERGFHSSSMRDLAAESGVSLAGLYYYVRSKDEILLLIQKRHLSELISATEAGVALATSPDDGLRRVIDAYLRFCSRHYDAMHVVIREKDSLPPAPRIELDDLWEKYETITGDVINSLTGEAVWPDTSSRVAAPALLGMLQSTTERFLPASDEELDDLGAQLTLLFLGGFTGSRTHHQKMKT